MTTITVSACPPRGHWTHHIQSALPADPSYMLGPHAVLIKKRKKIIFRWNTIDVGREVFFFYLVGNWYIVNYSRYASIYEQDHKRRAW